MNILLEIKNKIKNWTPQNNEDVAEMLYALSTINNLESGVKKQCYDFLNNTDEDYISENLNIKVKRVYKNTDIYNESEEVNNLIADIEVLKAKLKRAQQKAGINRTEITTYYKVQHEI